MSKSFRRHALRHGSLLVAAASFATAAAAADPAVETVQLRYTGPAAALVTQVHLPLGTQNYYVGNYTLHTQSPAVSFQAYCVDPFREAKSVFVDYTKTTLRSFLSGSTQKFADVSNLFGIAYADSIGNATKAAGFQLALWEVFNDDGNLASGLVFNTPGTNPAAVGEANRLLANLASTSLATPSTGFALTLFSNSDAQSYLAATPYLGVSVMAVPEPKAVVLMLFGLGFLGFASWRRQNRAPAA